MQEIRDIRRRASPVVTPQALAWDGNSLWLSSRDLGTLYQVDPEQWKIVEELDPPGIVWAAVFTNDGWRFTLGKGLNDDRYVYRYTATDGFKKLFACPDFAGSYLSFDGENCYLSQWYKGQIHQFDDSGKILRTLELGKKSEGTPSLMGRFACCVAANTRTFRTRPKSGAWHGLICMRKRRGSKRSLPFHSRRAH